jgi:hypothetical protein
VGQMKLAAPAAGLYFREDIEGGTHFTILAGDAAATRLRRGKTDGRDARCARKPECRLEKL